MDLFYCIDELAEARVIREETRSYAEVGTRFGVLPMVTFTDELSGRFETMEREQFNAMRCGAISDNMLAQLRDGEVRVVLAARD